MTGFRRCRNISDAVPKLVWVF